VLLCAYLRGADGRHDQNCDHEMGGRHDRNCGHEMDDHHRDADRETDGHRHDEGRVDRQYLVNRRSGVGLSPCWGGLGCSDGVQT